MTHAKWNKKKYWFESSNLPINLYKTEDGEIFTSKESMFKYLYENYELRKKSNIEKGKQQNDS